MGNTQNQSHHEGTGNLPQIHSTMRSEYFKNLIGEGSVIFELHLQKCSDLTSMDIGGKSDPYVNFKLKEKQFAGHQIQKSSYKSRTLNPVWAPPEVFKFLVNDKSAQKLIISVMDHDHAFKRKRDDVQGDCVVDLSEFDEDTMREMRVKLIDSKSGKRGRSYISFSLHCLSIQKGLAQANDVIYEFERNVPFKGWKKEHLQPGDHGPYASGDLLIHSANFEDCKLAMNEGFVEARPYTIVCHPSSPYGWQYATHCQAMDWFDEPGRLLSVRRRAHQRITIDPTYIEKEEIRQC